MSSQEPKASKIAISKTGVMASLLTGKTLAVRYGIGESASNYRDMQFQLGGNIDELMAALNLRWMADEEEAALAARQRSAQQQ